MELSLAFVKNESQVLYQTFQNGEAKKAQIFDFADLKGKELHSIFLPRELTESEAVKERLSETLPYAPVKAMDSAELNEELFDKLGSEEARCLTQSLYRTWAMRNNLNLVENLFEQLAHLKNLWPNDRTAFFEELWHLLRSNMGATSMKVAYNHMKKAEKENEKNQLIRVVVEGTSKPNPSENKELGDALFKNYEGLFTNNFEIHTYDEPSGKVVILGKIKESPVIIMAEVFEITQLQKSVLKCLFDGLQ